MWCVRLRTINLQDTGIVGSGCFSFGAAYLKSRSSDAFNSEIKDFVAPIPINITNCEPKVLDNTAVMGATNLPVGTVTSNTGQITVDVTEE